MMLSAQVPPRQTCSLLAVFSRKAADKQKPYGDDRPLYPLPELASSGRLEVQVLVSPTAEEFKRALGSFEPNFVYLQGEWRPNDEEIGPLVWGDVDLSTAEAVIGLFAPTLPTTVYLEIPNAEKLAEALHSKGVPYVIYWKNAFSYYAACHFRQALLSVVQRYCFTLVFPPTKKTNHMISLFTITCLAALAAIHGMRFNLRMRLLGSTAYETTMFHNLTARKLVASPGLACWGSSQGSILCYLRKILRRRKKAHQVPPQ